MQQQRSEDDSLGATTIVVPCYNEAERLDIDAFVAFTADRPWLTLIFVDDGSTDATAKAIDDARRRVQDRIHCLTLPRNSGKAEAVRRGVLQAIEDGPQLVGFWDADLATPLLDIDSFRALFEHQPDLQIVMGSRAKLLGTHIERSELRHYFGRIAATAVSGILGIPVYDTQCGAKLFRVQPGLPALFGEPFITRWAFDVEILARWLIHRETGAEAHRSIVEVPLQRWIDVPGSKLRVGDFLRAPTDLWRIWRRYGGAIRERTRRGA